MNKDTTRLGAFEWLLSAAIALIGSIILFDAHAGINWGIWVALAVLATLVSRRATALPLSRPPILLGAAAILAAGADARTTDTPVHVGIFWLTALLLAAFLYHIHAQRAEDVKLLKLAASPFLAAARVITSTLREIGIAYRGATDSPSKAILRRVLLVAPVVLVLIFLLGGADPIIHSAIQSVEDWIPAIRFSARTVFFGVLFVVLLGACSRLPDLELEIPTRKLDLSAGPSPADVTILVASTLATLGAFLLLQIAYLFIRLPGDAGNGITYAEYARRGFGELCVVVTIVAAVIIVAERFREPGDAARSRTLRRMEFALIAAAAIVLLSAQRRVYLYEQAYGYTVARVHATAYIVFISGVLILLALEIRRGGITASLGRRASALALAITLVILYWNDQGWIMSRNIDRIAVTGKFDAGYAARLSADAVPALIQRRGELLPADRDSLLKWAACEPGREQLKWYEWNAARTAARTARDAAGIRESSPCPRHAD